MLSIRPISAADASAVADLSAQLGYPAPVDVIRQRIHALSALPDHAAFAACLYTEPDTQVVGWIELSICRHLQADPYALISGLVVSEGMRSHGIGKQLCAAAESWTRDHGITTLRVRSRMTREQAHKFYLREGFHQAKVSALFEKTLLPHE